MKRYFAGQSQHGSSTSHGFSNDWTVYVFNNKKSRDHFVDNSTNLSCIAIKYRDVTQYAANWSMSLNRSIAPRPFRNEFWGIVDWFVDETDIPGCIGQVEVVDESDVYGDHIDRLYR